MKYKLYRFLLFLMFGVILTVETAAADSWISLTEIPIKGWRIYNGSSSDASPEYSPGINRMKSTGGRESGNYNVINGKMYENSIGAHVRDTGEKGRAIIEYDISSYDYDTFAATVGKAYASSGLSAKAQFFVYVDGKVAAESPILGPTEDYYMEVDITDAKSLAIAAGDGGDSILNDEVAWGNPVLFKKNEAIIEAIEFAGASYIIPMNGEIDLSTAEGHITYDNGVVKEVPVSDIEISGLDTSAEGKISVLLTYDSTTYEQEFYVVAPERYAYLSDMEISSYIILDAKTPKINTTEDGVTPANTGGISYSHGIWTHPTGNEADNGYGELVWNIANKGYTRLRVIVGKPNDTYCMKGMYFVYLDGKLLESSPLLYAGQTHTFDLDISGGSTLTLAVTGGEETSDFYFWDSTEWCDPVVWIEADVKAPIVVNIPDGMLWAVAIGFIGLMFVSSAVYTIVMKKNKITPGTSEFHFPENPAGKASKLVETR